MAYFGLTQCSGRQRWFSPWLQCTDLLECILHFSVNGYAIAVCEDLTILVWSAWEWGPWFCYCPMGTSLARGCWTILRWREVMWSVCFQSEGKLSSLILLFQMFSQETVMKFVPRYSLVLEVSDSGAFRRSLHDPDGQVVTYVSEAHEHDGYLYLGSFRSPFICRLSLQSI